MLCVTHRWSGPGDGIAKWHCACDCGKTTIAAAHHMKDGTTRSCGCLKFHRFKDMTGMKFNRLTVCERVENKGEGVKAKAQWKCLCECGNTTIVGSSSLRRGNTKSCGCLKIEANIANGKKLNFIHGMDRTLTHNTWTSMLQRCNYPQHKSYDLYGGRGITVCDRWMDFRNFYADMGDRKPGFSLDRINNGKGYYPENCRWATSFEQQNNRRDNIWISAFGRNETIANWSREVGLAETTILQRIGSGMTPEMALSTPPKKNGQRVSRFRVPLPA